jgi:serine/threonine-protein kinase
VFDRHESSVVVLKLIPNVPTGNPWHEAQILRRLSDRHILPIRNADLATGVPFVVTDLATHGTLEGKLDASSRLGLDIRDVIRWIRQASFGIARAHDLRLLHNDIKPDNLFLSAAGEALVGDFGGATLLPSGQACAVPFQATVCTMAPEVAADWLTGVATASFASDIYSLGATTYQLLAGAALHDFAGAVDRAQMRRIVASNPPDPIRDVAPHVPLSVAAVVQRALQKRPADRYESVVAFAEALARVKLPRRLWRRVNVHTAHVGCWEGNPTGGGGAYLMCLAPGSRPTQYELTTVHVSSGRRITKGCRIVPARSWPSGVRAVIHSLG